MTINDDPHAWFPHALAAVVLAGRVADLGSTYLASPSLTLETNPLVRRLGWRFALATLLVSAVPYYHTGYGVALAVASLMVAASNLSRVWVMRALGEQEYLRMLQLAAQRTARWKTLSFVGIASVCVVACAALLVWLSGAKSWGFWFACGLVLYAVAVAVYGMLFVARIYRMNASA